MRLIIDNSQFRLMLGASLTMSMGHFVFMIVQPWLALVETDSEFWVGATVGAAGAGLLAFSVVGGVLADRFDRRRLLALALCVQFVMAIGIAWLAFTDRIALSYIMTFAFVDAAMLGILAPSGIALMLDVVGRQQLLRAFSIQHVVTGAAGIVMPLAVGRVLDAFNVGWAYVMVAILHGAAVLLVLRLKPIVQDQKAVRASPFTELKEAVVYVFTTPGVRLLILCVLFIEYFGFMHEPMIPVMARDVLHSGATGLGYLFSAASIGSMAASLVLASFGEVRQKGRLAATGAALFGGMLVAFAWSRSLPLSLVLFGVACAGVVLYDTTMQTLLQVVVPDRMRGRVLGFQTATWGIIWLAGFQTGAIATVVGAPVTIAIGGAVALGTAGVLFLWAGRIKEVQPPEETQILEEPAGVPAALESGSGTAVPPPST